MPQVLDLQDLRLEDALNYFEVCLTSELYYVCFTLQPIQLLELQRERPQSAAQHHL